MTTKEMEVCDTCAKPCTDCVCNEPRCDCGNLFTDELDQESGVCRSVDIMKKWDEFPSEEDNGN